MNKIYNPTTQELITRANALFEKTFSEVRWHLIMKPPMGLPGSVADSTERAKVVAKASEIISDVTETLEFPEGTTLVMMREIVLEKTPSYILRDHSAELVFIFQGGKWRSLIG